MGSPFEMDFDIRYYDCDSSCLLTAEALTLYFQEMALNHSDKLGYTIKMLTEKKRGWAILNWRMRFYDSPEYLDKIHLTTWSNSCKSLQAIRCYSAKDKNGNIFAEAVSRWAFMDLENRVPVKILEGMKEAYSCEVPSPLPDRRFNLPIENEEDFYAERTFIVRKSDTDTNGHVNNVKYIQWAMDDLSDEFLKDNQLLELEVVYKKECYRDSNILSRCFICDLDEERKQTISIICNMDKPEEVYCKVAAVWGKQVCKTNI